MEDFENFIYSCNNVLDNAELGSMETAATVWKEDNEEAFKDAFHSKKYIKHQIIIENNNNLTTHIQHELEKITIRMTGFKTKHKMFNVNTMPNNMWFVGLYYLVSEYNEWFTDLIYSLKKKAKSSDYRKELWFIVGLLFANGKMDLLLKEFGNNGTTIAKHLGNKSFRPYITTTIGGHSKTDKNIFHSPEKIALLFNHCLAEGIEMTQAFKTKHYLSQFL